MDAESLIDGARELGIDLTTAAVKHFEQFHDLLETWNGRLNLTRVPPDDFVSRHFLDSLTCASALDFHQPGRQRVLDVGTGAGLPGLPLKIALPVISLTLVDATKKKLRFVDHVVEALALRQTNTVHARAEAIGHQPSFRQQYDVVLARAVAPLNVLVEYLLPCARVGGVAVALKSRNVDEELNTAQPAIETLGGAVRESRSVTSPTTDIERRLVVVEKVRATPSGYPRDAKTIRTSPL